MTIASAHELFRVKFDKFDSFDSPEFSPEAVDILFRDKEQELIEEIATKHGFESTQTLTDYFPMEAEEPNFSRPRIPYECGKTNTCGKGTHRTPKSSC